MGVPPHGLTLNPLNPIMTTKPSSMTLGILASILAALLFTLMDVAAKAVSYLGTGELTFVRGLVGLFFLPLIAKRESLPLFSGKDRLLLHTRGIFGGMGILLFFFCLKGLTLGDAEILVQLAAFFMCILSPIFLKTTPSGQVRVWLFIIAAGAAVVLRIWDYSSFNGYALVASYRPSARRAPTPASAGSMKRVDTPAERSSFIFSSTAWQAVFC